MSRICALCDKKSVRANNVSHANNKTPRRQKPNLQTLLVDGKRVRACTACRRTRAKK